jgi:hypothetical protein
MRSTWTDSRLDDLKWAADCPNFSRPDCLLKFEG